MWVQYLYRHYSRTVSAYVLKVPKLREYAVEQSTNFPFLRYVQI